MNLLDRYIARMILLNSAMVMVVLMTLFFFSTFVAEVGSIGTHQYDFSSVIYFSTLLLPRQTYELFPMIALLGTMLGLGVLSSSSELTVMRAAGISIERVMLSVLKVGLIMVVAVTLLGELLAPRLELQARESRAHDLGKTLSHASKTGIWVKEGQQFIQIGRLLQSGLVLDLTLYEFDRNGQLLHITAAEEARFDQGHWRLYVVTTTRMLPRRVEVSQQATQIWATDLTPEVMGLVVVRPEHLSVIDLYEYVGYLDSNGLDSSAYAISFWNRLLAPLATAAMVLLAVPFVFGTNRGSGVGQRILVGVLLGIGFYLVNGIMRRIAQLYDIPPLLSALLPLLLLVIIFVLLRRRQL